MSNSHLFLSSGFPRVTLKNGLGRYINQLQRVVIKFCKTHGDSSGVRDFVESHLVNFARGNPSVTVYLKPRRHRAPTLTAEFCNGEKSYMNLHNMSKEEVFKWLTLFTQQGGRQVMRYRKHWHTDSPSIQGVWTPTTFRDISLNNETFPSEKFMGPKLRPLTATELLVAMAEKEKNSASQVD